MSNINLGLTTSHTQSESKENAASKIKTNTWSTPFIFSNDCMKNIMEFCNIHQIFRLAGVNRHCNHIASTTYSNLSFHLSTLHSNFTDLGSFVTQLESIDEEGSRIWNDNLKSDIVSRNGNVKFLSHDLRSTIGAYQDILIKKGKNSLEVVNKKDGECLIDLVPRNGNTQQIIRAFRITQKEYISISSDGSIDFYNIKSLIKGSLSIRAPASHHSSFFDISGTDLFLSVTKVFLIEDKLYLLCKKIYEIKFIIMSYAIKENSFSACCKHSSKGNPVVNCIANKTHLFVIFQNAIACYDNQNKLVWEIEERYSNEKSLLEINDKFLIITSYPELDASYKCNYTANYRIIDIKNRKCVPLKSLELRFKEDSLNEYFNFWGDYVISVSNYKSFAFIRLWNPNDGQLIINIQKQFNFCNEQLLILKGKKGLIGFSEKEVHFGQLSKEQRRHCKHVISFKTKLMKYEFFLLKPPVIPKKMKGR